MTPWLTDALLRAQSDERLVVLARDGHDRAFVAIVERYRRELHAYAGRLLPGGPAEDVLQQALVNAWAALRNGTEVAHVRGWLYEIVRNAAWRTARARQTTPLPEELPDRAGTDERVERSLLLRSTFAELAQMPERQRAALVGTAMQGRSREELAGALGISEGAVRQLVHRARTSLRAAVTAVTPMPAVAWAAGAAAQPGSVTARITELTAGAGASAGVAGALIKSSAVMLAVGAAAGGAVGIGAHHRRATARPPIARAATDAGHGIAPTRAAPAHDVPARVERSVHGGSRPARRRHHSSTPVTARRDVSRSSGPGHGDSSGDGERDTISQRGPADTRRDGRDGSDDGDDSGGTVPALGESRGGDSDTTSGDSGAGSGGGDGAGMSSGDDGGQSSDGGGSGDGSGDDRLLQQTSPDQ